MKHHLQYHKNLTVEACLPLTLYLLLLNVTYLTLATVAFCLYSTTSQKLCSDYFVLAARQIFLPSPA